MTAHIARPIAPHALLAEIERVFVTPPAARQDPWQRKLYEEWVARLGAERMRGFLISLRDQLAVLGDLVVEGERDGLHKLAHDVRIDRGHARFPRSDGALPRPCSRRTATIPRRERPSAPRWRRPSTGSTCIFRPSGADAA